MKALHELAFRVHRSGSQHIRALRFVAFTDRKHSFYVFSGLRAVSAFSFYSMFQPSKNVNAPGASELRANTLPLFFVLLFGKGRTTTQCFNDFHKCPSLLQSSNNDSN